jgi:hypothetical protein
VILIWYDIGKGMSRQTWEKARKVGVEDLSFFGGRAGQWDPGGWDVLWCL